MLRALERLYRAKAAVPHSLLQACRLGVDAEIENAAMYERLLAATRGHFDVQRVLRRPRSASQERHPPALQRCADRESARGPGSGARRGRSGGGPGPHRQRLRRRGA